MTSQELSQLRTGITVLRNIAPLLEKAEQVLLSQPAPALPASAGPLPLATRRAKKKADKEGELLARLITGKRKP